MNILSLQKNVPTAPTSQLFRAPWSCRERDPEEPGLSFHYNCRQVDTADQWDLLPSCREKNRWFYRFFFCITHLPSFSWHLYTLCREMVITYYLISLYAYHLIYTSQDILKAFKRLILLEDKKLFTETVIPTLKTALSIKARGQWLGIWMMTQHILNVVSQMDTMVDGSKWENPNELKSLTFIKELPGYRI